jgi:uncharacterized protein YbjT (DUF2867 family)
MTVIVTGASGLIGRAAIPELRARNPEVRAAVRDERSAASVRALGAKVTVGRLEDADALAEVMKDVHTVIHLAGGANHADDEALLHANFATTLTALRAAELAGARRFVLLSYPGASPDAGHQFLRAKGLAEEAVATARLEHAIVRCTHVYGVGGLWFAAVVEGALARPPVVLGDGAQSLAPVFVDDVALVLAAIDDRRELLVGTNTTYALEGPDVVTADELAAVLSEGARDPEHVAGGAARDRLRSLLGVSVSGSAAELFAQPSRADAPDAAAAFGVTRTPLAEGLRLTLERAASASR